MRKYHPLAVCMGMRYVVGLCLVLAGCSSSPTAPSTAQIRLTLSAATVAVNGTIDVQATVTQATGAPVADGTVVTFTAGVGTFAPREAWTSGGIARTVYTATASGLTTISALSGSAKADDIQIRVGASAVERLTIRTDPATLPASGGTATVIIAAVDASGRGLPSTPITLSTSAGDLSSASAVTDASGEARVSITTTRAAAITATAGTRSAFVTLAPSAPPSISLTCGSATVGVTASCAITPVAGSASIALVALNWGDSTAEVNLGALTATTAASHVYTTAGTFAVTAFVRDSLGQAAQQTASLVVTRQPASVSLSGPSSGVVGTAVIFSVSASGVGTPTVSVDFGDGTSQTVNGSGVSKTYTAAGTYTVTATAIDGAGTRGSASLSITIAAATTTTTPSASTSVLMSQESNVASGCAAFNVSASPATGASISSIVVKQTGSGTQSWTFSNVTYGRIVTCGLTKDTDILTATATDSKGGTATYQIIVR